MIELVDESKVYDLKHPSGAVFQLKYWTFAMQEEIDKRCVIQDGKGGVSYDVGLERQIKIKNTVQNWSGIMIPDANGGLQEAPCTPENKSRLPVGIVFWLVKNIDEMAGIKMPDAEKKKLELAVTLLMSGIPMQGILEKTGFPRIPSSIIKYLFCSPAADYEFRCLPSSGGLYDQRYIDFVEFTIIENKIKQLRQQEARV